MQLFISVPKYKMSGLINMAGVTNSNSSLGRPNINLRSSDYTA